VRSKKAMHDVFGDITGSNTIEFKVVKKNGKPQARKKRVIIMDEVDGMGAGDRSGMAELISMIKNTHVPIICICNDRQSQKIRSLVPYCMDLRYRRPVKSVIANRAIAIAAKEGLTVERNAAEAIAESCGNDVRQVLNALQMWSSNNKGTSQLSYKSLKDREHSINKDAILRVSLFDAARVILEGRKGLQGTDAKAQRQHFFRRNDAFFVDYNFVGLLVQQNYLKVMTAPFNDAKRSNDPAKVGDVLDRMYSAAESMSDFAHAENGIRGANMNWGLLPLTAVLTVKTGYHAGGEMGGFLPGFPEFSAWLGKNSSKGRKTRLLHELQHHVNYRISGGNQEMRLSYVPIFRERFLSLLSSKDDNAMDEAIELMDEYGMDRDDIFETLDEFNMDSKADSFAKIDSKAKAAFTRAYNARAHKSQALVAEQGASKAPKRKASSNDETADPDAIDDDKIEEEEEEDDEADVEKLKAMFKKKGRKAAARKPKAASKPKGKKK
jgi:replication factor C subunit 1